MTLGDQIVKPAVTLFTPSPGNQVRSQTFSFFGDGLAVANGTKSFTLSFRPKKYWLITSMNVSARNSTLFTGCESVAYQFDGVGAQQLGNLPDELTFLTGFAGITQAGMYHLSNDGNNPWNPLLLLSPGITYALAFTVNDPNIVIGNNIALVAHMVWRASDTPGPLQ